MAMKIALCLILLASVCSAQVARVLPNAAAHYAGDGVTDRVGTNNLTLVNGAFFTHGIFGGAYAFTNTAAATAPLPFGGNTNNFTVSLWFRRTANSNATENQVLVCIGNSSQNGITVFLNRANNYRIDAARSGAALLTGSIVAEIGKWYHVAYPVRSGIFYVNGKRANATTSTGTYNAPQFGLGLATVSENPGVATLKGNLSQVTIYMQTLSPQEIAALANSRRRNHSQ
jgi:hypothetical protein